MKNLPTFEDLPVAKLAGVFRSTTNSYKLLWFLSLLEIIRRRESNVILIRDVLHRMVYRAWFPVNYFRLSLGKLDQMSEVIRAFIERTDLTGMVTEKYLLRRIEQYGIEDAFLKRKIELLGRYVPYRFLTPFFADQLRNIKDSERNKLIRELADAAFFHSTAVVPLYRFMDEQRIEIHPVWYAYLEKHDPIIRDFCLWHLLDFLQTRNPNVPNIQHKIFPPQTRSLARARRFWDYLLSRQSLRCIYSGEMIRPVDYDLDHFLPWSFVTHDALWNLLPAPSNVNSSKSDSLPDLDAYLAPFSDLQYQAYQLAYDQKGEKAVEDYILLFQESAKTIAGYSQADFSLKLGKRLVPLSQIAANMGFQENWIFAKRT